MSDFSNVTYKKTFVPIMDILLADTTATIDSVLDQIAPIAAAKQRGATKGESAKNHLKDLEGNVVGIRCYYYKRWMPVVGAAAVEFGVKASSATGFNTMSKSGQSHWSKQHSLAKRELLNLFDQLEAGELAPEDISSAKQAIEDKRNEVVETEELSFDTIDELQEHLEAEGIVFPEAK